MKTPTIENRKARYDYYIEDTIECGIALYGNEVKSIRSGCCSLKESFASIDNGEVILKQCYIKKYETSNTFDVDENRNKKLLLHKSEIRKIGQTLQQNGYTLVPLKIYFTDAGKCKCLLGICKGKKNYDKRNALKERTIERTIKQYV